MSKNKKVRLFHKDITEKGMLLDEDHAQRLLNRNSGWSKENPKKKDASKPDANQGDTKGTPE